MGPITKLSVLFILRVPARKKTAWEGGQRC